MPVARHSSSRLPGSPVAKLRDHRRSGRRSGQCPASSPTASACSSVRSRQFRARAAQAAARRRDRSHRERHLRHGRIGRPGPSSHSQVRPAPKQSSLRRAQHRSAAPNEKKPKFVPYPCGEPPKIRRFYYANTCRSACRESPSRVAFLGIGPERMPPALVVVRKLTRSRLNGSTRSGRFSDESFRLCDIQFDRPKVLVEPCTAFDECGDFDGTRRFDRVRRPASGNSRRGRGCARGRRRAGRAR